MVDRILAVLSSAWGMVTDIPLPGFLRGRAGVVEDDDAEFISLSFPVVGLLFGFILFVLGWLIGNIFSPGISGVLFGILCVLLSEVKDSGRGFGLSLSYVENLVNGEGPGGSFRDLESDWRSFSGLVATLTGVILLGLKFFCFRELYLCGSSSWVMGVFVLGFGVQGYLSGCRSIYTGESFLGLSGSARYHIWLVCIFIMLFYISHPAPVLLSLLVSVLLSIYFGRYAEESYHGLDASMITLIGVFTELAVLVIGVVLLV